MKYKGFIREQDSSFSFLVLFHPPPDYQRHIAYFIVLTQSRNTELGFLPIGTLPVSLLESPIITFQGKNLALWTIINQIIYNMSLE